MEKVLIVSNNRSSVSFFTEMLTMASIFDVDVVSSCTDARRLLVERTFDLVIINAPLRDESGERLSKHISSGGTTQVILVVSSEFYDDVSAITEDVGVLTVAKPINRAVFWSVLKLAKAANNRFKVVQAENDTLKKKIQDIKFIDRAKCSLISYLGMSEQEAHRYIEKQAMDMRQTKREVAEGILKTYEY